MKSELQFKSELVKAQIEIKDQTLLEISRELHDNIGQIISVAIMQVNLGLEQSSAVTKENLSELKEVLSKSLNEIRLLSRVINKENILNSNLTETISADLERIQNLKKIKCDFLDNTTEPIYNPEHELIIYRIFQESLLNILKHSHSEIVNVAVTTRDGGFEMIINDTGKGFDINLKTKGSGLKNMKHRATLIGAKISFKSVDQVTSIRLFYPNKKQDDQPN
ncbi:sensor histidine kinase [Flavobacterium ichthyis]|nr:histidine kinase [Flavobacterium ichthyis]